MQKLEYELIDDNDQWLQNRQLDEFINDDLLLNCLSKINNTNDNEILDEAIKRIENIDNPSLFDKNKQFHKYLIEGITIDSKKYKINPTIKLIDFDNIKNNVFQVSHQIRYKEGGLSQIRIPDDKILLSILDKIDFPLAQTSCNMSNEKELKNSDEIYEKFGDKIDLIIASENDLDNKPSTIVSIVDNDIKILRQGSVIFM